MKTNGKQTRSRSILLSTFEALCLKKVVEEAINRLETAGTDNNGIIPNSQVIEYLENVVDKIDSLPYFGASARAPKVVRGATKTNETEATA